MTPRTAIPALARIAAIAAIALPLVLLVTPRDARAQQAIVSMPSADITPRGELFFMHETQARPWGQKYWNTTHFFTAGVGGNTELALTLFNWGIPSTRNMTMALGFKSALPVLEGRLPVLEPKLTVGAMLLSSASGRGLGHWAYAHASFRIPRLQTRISLGVTHATEQLFEKRAWSMIASIEQPLPFVDGLVFNAEWFSGDHDLSNLILGLSWHPNHTWIFVLGYKIPTKDAIFTVSEQALVAEVGFFF